MLKITKFIEYIGLKSSQRRNNQINDDVVIVRTMDPIFMHYKKCQKLKYLTFVCHWQSEWMIEILANVFILVNGGQYMEMSIGFSC